jgi:hypothetical protein
VTEEVEAAPVFVDLAPEEGRAEKADPAERRVSSISTNLWGRRESFG